MRKNLPQGSWLSFCGLDKRTTDEDIQAAFADAGVDVGLDRISVTTDDDHRNAYAVVSLTREHTRRLLARALMNENGAPVKLHGRDLSPLIPNNASKDW